MTSVPRGRSHFFLPGGSWPSRSYPRRGPVTESFPPAFGPRGAGGARVRVIIHPLPSSLTLDFLPGEKPFPGQGKRAKIFFQPLLMRFYCPGCWRDFPTDEPICPHCGLDIQAFWQSCDYVDKLILALHHPEKDTPLRAAWLLGQLKEPRAVAPLIRVIEETEDVYLARAAAAALAEIGTPEAWRFLRTLTGHPVKMVRDEVQRLLRQEGEREPRPPEP